MKREISIAFQTDKTPAQYIALARLVNEYVFDAVSVYCDAPYHPAYSALLLMAPHIQRARIGPAAVSPARIPPIDIAANTALLAQMAAGGVYIGLARGAWLDDVGIAEPARPIQAMREAAADIRRLLAGDAGSDSGEFYRLAPHVRAPYPLPPPGMLIRLMIGTWGRRLAALAGEIADEVKVGGSANPELVPVMAGWIAEGERIANRPEYSVGLVMGAVTVVDEDRTLARQAARRAVALYLPVVAPLDPTLSLEPEMIQRVQAAVHASNFDAAAALISDDLLDCFAFAGSPHDLIARAEALFDAGARRVEFGTPHGAGSDPATAIRLIGETVLPALAPWQT
ncbi:MAG TPA: LLM class flavin-dependent oxidoreductase [Candidatus Limnocylindrales bacterium]|nr:LLM class flavin-dependent oxidoreductase [Candidatus Limnocylindrales bacterium]